MKPTDYYKLLRDVVISFGNEYIHKAYQIEYDEFSHKVVISCEEFVLPNGGNVRFYEDIVNEDGVLIRLAYSFAYTRPESAIEGISFRYEKDPENADGMAHPLHHLHTGGRVPNNEPRFPTAEMSIIDLFRFVIEQIE